MVVTRNGAPQKGFQRLALPITRHADSGCGVPDPPGLRDFLKHRLVILGSVYWIFEGIREEKDKVDKVCCGGETQRSQARRRRASKSAGAQNLAPG